MEHELSNWQPKVLTSQWLAISPHLSGGLKKAMPFELDPNQIYLGFDPNIWPDWQTASRHIRCVPGIVAVEMLAAPEKLGSLYIPQRATRTHYEDDEPVGGFEPSLGVVLSGDLEPGTVVICRDEDGLEFEQFSCGSYKSKNPVRFFGLVGVDGQESDDIEVLPWEESILATMEIRMDTAHIKRMTGNNILIERDADELDRTTEGGLVLPDAVSQNNTCEGTVLMVGPEVRDVCPGDRVLYHPSGKQDFYDPDNKRLRIIRRLAVQAILEGAVAV